MIIKTQRLILRELEQDDAQALHPVFSNPEATHFTLRTHSSVEETLVWIEAIRQGYKKHGFGPWGVVRISNDALIGYCGCGYILLNGKKECEIGYRIIPSCWGQGFATEAVLASVDDTFARLPFTKIVSLIQLENIASIRVAEKAGMFYQCDTIYEGVPMRIYEINANNRGGQSAGADKAAQP
jgi:RimJ/RimL family protein N-acetyltransferase